MLVILPFCTRLQLAVGTGPCDRGVQLEPREHVISVHEDLAHDDVGHDLRHPLEALDAILGVVEMGEGPVEGHVVGEQETQQIEISRLPGLEVGRGDCAGIHWHAARCPPRPCLNDFSPAQLERRRPPEGEAGRLGRVGDLEPGQPLEQRRERHLALHAPEVEAEAMVVAVAEREVVARVAAPHVEAPGSREDGRVAIGRHRADAEELARPERDAAELAGRAPSSAR